MLADDVEGRGGDQRGRAGVDSVIADIELYKHEPWELPGLASTGAAGGDGEWYFFNPPDKKYPRGQRTNRATRSGYWKPTGKDRKVLHNKDAIGTKKTLVFYQGRAPSGERTDWVMHEYQLTSNDADQLHAPPVKKFRHALVLCRVMKKRGPRSTPSDYPRAQHHPHDQSVVDPCEYVHLHNQGQACFALPTTTSAAEYTTACDASAPPWTLSDD